MKKIRKGKKMLIILLIAIILIIATVVIVNIVNKQQETPQGLEEVQQVIQLPETKYNNMDVKNVQMEYLKDNNETIVKMELHNTTENVLENEKINVIWVGPNDEVLGEIVNPISRLEVGEVVRINVILDGDLTATKQIKLVKK